MSSGASWGVAGAASWWSQARPTLLPSKQFNPAPSTTPRLPPRGSSFLPYGGSVRVLCEFVLDTCVTAQPRMVSPSEYRRRIKLKGGVVCLQGTKGKVWPCPLLSYCHFLVSPPSSCHNRADHSGQINSGLRQDLILTLVVCFVSFILIFGCLFLFSILLNHS